MGLLEQYGVIDRKGNLQIGNGEFFKSLGQYVYAYIDDDGTWLYTGKGNGNRGVQHIKTKGYDVDKLYIVARNLERFEDKNDWQSFLLESFLISKYEPTDNRVSGHYKECFVMAKWSELFNEFTASQYDNFESLPNWYMDNYDKLKGRINVLEIKSDVTVITGQTRDKIQMSWFIDNNGNPYNIRFAVWADGDKLESKKEQLFAFLNACGYSDIEKVGNREFYQVEITSIDEVLNLFDNFMG
jgi:hypothetical protein